MAYWDSFACQPERSGVCEQRFEVTPGEHGIKMNVKLNVGVVAMFGFGDRKQMLGAVEEIKLFNWPEGLDGGITVLRAYYNANKWNPLDVQYKTEFKGSPPENLLQQPIAYKHVVIKGNNPKRATRPMCINLRIDWLPNESGTEYSDFDVESNPDPNFKLKSSDGICLYLKGDWINGFSTLLKRYREGNYDQKMSKSDDGCFECPEFDAETLEALFSYGQHKKLHNQYSHTLNDRFMDVMRAADYFGANRACGELFAMQTRRLIYKGRTKDTFWHGTNPMSARDYLNLWHQAIKYNFPEMKMMLARYTHWFTDELRNRKDQTICDEYCKLMAGISN